ncbi:MAG TPA: hypothetical protein VK789_16955 [Bryobacteraceae bacterium]|jgi:hypothetical protein|nr:hypothetical protein [Bryobacteraceae bacterium]
MKPVLLIAFATLCFAYTEPRVSLAAIHAVETSMNNTFGAHGTDPWVLYGNSRGTYLDGYGVLFTFDLDLINTGGLTFNPSPFKPTVSPEEIATVRDRKMKKLPELREAMRSILTDSSTTLEGLPAHERISMEASLLSYSWEKNGKDMPRRIFMTAEKQKLLDAKTSHATQAQLANIIDEQDQ